MKSSGEILLNELDEVLKLILQKSLIESVTLDRLYAYISKREWNYGMDDLEDILSQLESDGFILKRSSNLLLPEAKIFTDGFFEYSLTWDGKFFLATSGYLKKVENQKLEFDLAKKNQKQLFVLTALASVGTVGILILEIVKYCEMTHERLLCSILWVGIIIFGLLLRKAMIKLFL